jgi:hypothetical protein
MQDIVLSVAVLGVAVLVLGAVAQWRRGERKRAVLIAIAALVIAGNIAIWSLPAVPVATAGHSSAT